MLGLTWANVDLDAGTVTVKGQLGRAGSGAQNEDEDLPRDLDLRRSRHGAPGSFAVDGIHG